MFSLETIPQKDRQINPDCGFRGQRMFVWIPLTGRTVAGACACVCVCMCVWCLCLSVQRRTGERGRRERVWSFVFSSARCLRLVVYSLQLSQQANYVEKLQQRVESHIFLHTTTTGDDYMMQKITGNGSFVLSHMPSEHVS